jgi:ribA/ribD-fused uncharacterized protein
METEDKILFYSHRNKFAYMSNFYECNFTDNINNYNCSEQYFMKKKQELFDPTNLILSNKILQNSDPVKIKQFGRQVKNYNEQIWNNSRYEIMKNGLILKFTQNPHIRQKLIDTFPKNLYEASPYDNIWGTGHDALDTFRLINENQEHILGKNLLGLALEEIRLKLILI